MICGGCTWEAAQSSHCCRWRSVPHSPARNTRIFTSQSPQAGSGTSISSRPGPAWIFTSARTSVPSADGPPHDTTPGAQGSGARAVEPATTPTGRHAERPPPPTRACPPKLGGNASTSRLRAGLPAHTRTARAPRLPATAHRAMGATAFTQRSARRALGVGSPPGRVSRVRGSHGIAVATRCGWLPPERAARCQAVVSQAGFAARLPSQALRARFSPPGQGPRRPRCGGAWSGRPGRDCRRDRSATRSRCSRG